MDAIRHNLGLPTYPMVLRAKVFPMPQSRDDLERQLSQAKMLREACAERLKQNGIDEKSLKKQPAWRSANASCRKLSRRLQTVSKKEQLTAELAARKAAAEGDEG